jgi:hypothetical protein
MSRRSSAFTAIAFVFIAFGAIIFLLARGGGGRSDEEAVRAWFGSPAGGIAPRKVRQAIEVDVCTFTSVRDVLTCPIRVGGNPTLHPCFRFSHGRVLRGGWQFRGVDSCSALRYDAARHTLVNMETGERYPV